MNVTKKDLERLIEKLQMCVDEMEYAKVDEIPTSCNTYGMHKFISFGSSGYLSLDNECIEFDVEDDDYECY